MKPHPKGIALLNRLIQIMTLLLQKEMGSSSHPISREIKSAC